MAKMYIILLLFKIFCLCIGSRVARRTNDQPDEGKCNKFNRGGASGLHYYVCCNNCVNGVPDPTCNGKTYQTASAGKYCGSCGVDLQKGDGNLKAHFYCGGCNGQDYVQKECTVWWKQIKGFCWTFANCFHNLCEERYGRGNICNFNRVCDSGETSDNCPVDCCYQKNAECTWSDTCLRECCGDTSCCITSGSGRLAAYFKYALAMIMLSSLLIPNIL